MKDFIVKYWLETLFGIIAGTLSLAVKRLYSKFKEQQLIKEGVLAILHDRLYRLCREYINQGYMTVEDMRNLEYIYRAYHSLGGNGTGTELYERCINLRIK